MLKQTIYLKERERERETSPALIDAFSNLQSLSQRLKRGIERWRVNNFDVHFQFIFSYCTISHFYDILTDARLNIGPNKIIITP